MKYQDKIRIFSQKQENQNISIKSGKNQKSSTAASSGVTRGGPGGAQPHHRSFDPHHPQFELRNF
jgi:hypothetical protein